ncbi:MAG: protein tyrosine phosphatase [Hyphomicrobiales bacterium]|nr:protein tyrosine phosphatase [Hyphomicrobiales bacterium]
MGREPIDPPIYVCSVEGLNVAARLIGASRLISLLNPEMMAELATPAEIAPHNHLRLVMSDIVAPAPGRVLPTAEHARRLIAFAAEWDGESPLLIHCRAGRSRSTAAAFIIACQLRPDLPETDIAEAMRASSATAQPNALLVRLGDEALNRGGRMVRAAEAIGQGDPAHNALFRLRLPARAAEIAEA